MNGIITRLWIKIGHSMCNFMEKLKKEEKGAAEIVAIILVIVVVLAVVVIFKDRITKLVGDVFDNVTTYVDQK